MNYVYRGSAGNYGYMMPAPAPAPAGIPMPQSTTMPGYPATVPMNPGMQMQGVAPGMPVGPMAATTGDLITPSGTTVAAPQFEQSYVENILRLNLGKVGTFYMTYENNCEWNAKIFRGAIEAAGRDHIIISDTTTGQRILLLMVNLDYVTFDEPLNYTYPGVIGNPPQPR